MARYIDVEPIITFMKTVDLYKLSREEFCNYIITIGTLLKHLPYITNNEPKQ